MGYIQCREVGEKLQFERFRVLRTWFGFRKLVFWVVIWVWEAFVYKSTPWQLKWNKYWFRWITSNIWYTVLNLIPLLLLIFSFWSLQPWMKSIKGLPSLLEIPVLPMLSSCSWSFKSEWLSKRYEIPSLPISLLYTFSDIRLLFDTPSTIVLNDELVIPTLSKFNICSIWLFW